MLPVSTEFTATRGHLMARASAARGTSQWQAAPCEDQTTLAPQGAFLIGLDGGWGLCVHGTGRKEEHMPNLTVTVTEWPRFPDSGANSFLVTKFKNTSVPWFKHIHTSSERFNVSKLFSFF